MHQSTSFLTISETHKIATKNGWVEALIYLPQIAQISTN
jgi:hypothetical protein